VVTWKHRGPAIAEQRARQKANRLGRTESAPARARVGCDEHRSLLDEFGAAVHELLALYEVQFAAIVQGDTDSGRFDVLIHMANEKKQSAKYAYMRHVESHGCANFDAIKKTRT
jgi:hypothetical protein